MAVFWRQFKQLLKILFYPWPVLGFFRGAPESEHGVGLGRKLALLRGALRNSSLAGSASTFPEHLILMRGVLSIPKKTEGAVAEFGCYKGAATASLSLACAATGRKLLVFDSFEGLPEPNEKVTSLMAGMEIPYRAGDLRGTLDEVTRTVRACGALEVCEFVKGFFDQTLPLRSPCERYALIFEDADLPQSVRAVLEQAWPRLGAGCFFYCHEARDKEVVELFYDAIFWRERLKSKTPGYVGSGCGLPLDPRGSMLGYALKSASLAIESNEQPAA